jgi:hypothetical protein
MTLKLPSSEEMALVGVGTLAAGSTQLPTGVHRQYNLLEIWPEKRRLCVHMREAVSDVIFAASSRAEFGGASFTELGWSPTPAPRPRKTKLDKVLAAAFEGFGLGHYQQAADLLHGADPNNPSVRQLSVEALLKIGEHAKIATLLSEPRNQDELMLLIDSLVKVRDTSAARAALESQGQRLGVARDIAEQLEARIQAAESHR